MNFLQLCQRAREKCLMQGTGPSAVTGQTGEMLRLVNWVNESWLDIQKWFPENQGRYWAWMRGAFSFTTTDGVQAYLPSAFTAPLTDVRFYLKRTFRVYTTADGVAQEQYMDFIDYDTFVEQWMYRTPTRSRPTGFSIDKSNNSILITAPDAVGYTVYGKYVKQASEMAANTDIPGLPADHHMLIIYRTMMKYGASKAAQEVYSEGKIEFERTILQLVADQTEQLSLGDPLVE